MRDHIIVTAGGDLLCFGKVFPRLPIIEANKTIFEPYELTI